MSDDEFTRWLADRGLTLHLESLDLQAGAFARHTARLCASGDHAMCLRVARAYEIPPWVICGAEPRPGRIGYMAWQIATWGRRARRWVHRG